MFSIAATVNPPTCPFPLNFNHYNHWVTVPFLCLIYALIDTDASVTKWLNIANVSLNSTLVSLFGLVLNNCSGEMIKAWSLMDNWCFCQTMPLREPRIVWFQKISIPPPRRELEILKGRGDQRPRKFRRGGGLYDRFTFQRFFDSVRIWVSI